MRSALALLVLIAGGCVTHVAKQCPTCAVVDADRTRLPALKPGTERLFVLVPGLLGYGWEWDAPVARLRATPRSTSSSSGGSRGARSTARRASSTTSCGARWSRRRRRCARYRGGAHSAGGMVAAHAVGRLPLPPRKLTLVTIGALFAGHAHPPVERGRRRCTRR